MTVGYTGLFFPLKVSGETNWMSSSAAVPLHEGGTGGACLWSRVLILTPIHSNTAMFYCPPKSISLLPENIILYKNMTFFRK